MQSMGIVLQLSRGREKYVDILEASCDESSTGDGALPLLKIYADTARLASEFSIFEKKSNRSLILVDAQSSDGSEVNEVVLRLQGYMIEGKLPPVRQHQIPHNPSRLVSMQESVTITGLGSHSFDLAVQAIQAIHQRFARHVGGLRGRLRDWSPGEHDGAFSVTFANRYLSAARDAVGETVADIGKVVDPYSVLRPILLTRTEVHLTENVVEHWERSKVPDGQGHQTTKFVRIKPDIVNIGQLLEIQVSFVVVKVGRDEYCMLPKIRAICVMDRTVEMDYNAALLNIVHRKKPSPTKKTKRRVGYDQEEHDGGDGEGSPVPEMKRMCIDG